MKISTNIASQNFINKIIRTWEHGTLLQKDLENVTYSEVKKELAKTNYHIGSSYTQEISTPQGNKILKIKGVCGSVTNKMGVWAEDLSKKATIIFNKDGDILQLSAYGKDSEITVAQILRTPKQIERLKAVGINAKLISRYEKKANATSKMYNSDTGMIYSRRNCVFGIEFPDNYNP